MPYVRPSWATAARQKLNQVASTLGNAGNAVKTSTDIGVMPVAPGTARRALPDLTIPGVKMPKMSTTKIDLGRNSVNTTGSRTFTNQAGPLGATGTIAKAGQVTLRTLGKILEKTNPSEIYGSVKASAKEAASAIPRFAGSIQLAADVLINPLVAKMLKGLKLTPDELRNADAAFTKYQLDQLKKMGYDLSAADVNDAFRKQVLSDAFTTAEAVAVVAPVAEAGIAAIKGAPVIGRALLSNLVKGEVKTALEGTAPTIERTVIDKATKTLVTEIIAGKGEPLIIDTAGNIFENLSTKTVVKYFIKSGTKEVLKSLDSVVKPLAIEIYKQGMVTELMNEARKFIAPETAFRIERDSRKYTDELSTSERLFLDLALGIYLPFEVPGLKTTYNFLKTSGKELDTAIISGAISKFFSDDESIKVFNRLAEFRDLKTSLPGDIQLKSNLLKHISTVMKEDGIKPTAEHVAELLRSWSNGVGEDVVAMLKRAELEGSATALNWYSTKLGRPLTQGESLMHWFVTESGDLSGRIGYAGDLGGDLQKAFDNAFQLRTTGAKETYEAVEKIVQKQRELVALAGDVIKTGDAASARQAIDGLLVNKTDLLTLLKTRLVNVGSDLLVQDGKLIVPEQFLNVPEIRQILDQLKGATDDIMGTLAEARGMGISDNLLKLPSNKWLLDKAAAYDKYAEAIAKFESGQVGRDVLVDVSLANLQRLKRFMNKSPENFSKIIEGKASAELNRIFDSAAGNLRDGLMQDAGADEIARFLMSVPSNVDFAPSIPRWVSNTLSKAERETLKMNEAISNFDKHLLEVMRTSPKALPMEKVSEVVTEMRRIEAQLPRGAFAPEFLAKETRWGAGVTDIPLALENLSPKQWATSVAELMDANGVTRAITDYITPHNPTDIYIKAMNKLNALVESQAPGKSEAIMKAISKEQDRGISLIPLMPGGGPRWEGLGKPMISGVDWKTLDKIGAQFGVNNLGRISREAFVNTFTESGFKPGVVDRLRSAPGIGAVYDAIYRQYMLTRFALNPMFHAQQVPEAAVIGFLRSMNLPEGMASSYLKSATRSPLMELTADESTLYKAIFGSKTGAGKIGREGADIVAGSDLLKGATLEERKRLAAFMAEFPVQIRGQLFDMPALKNIDPLSMDEYKGWILGLQNNPKAMAEAIDIAFATKGFDLKSEAIRRAMKSTNVEVQKFTSYNLNRSALEKDLHSIIFPFSYQKKFWTEVGKAVTGGSVARPVIATEALQRISDFNESPSMMETRAKYPTMVGWAWQVFPFNPTYPLVDLKQGSLWMGGVRADPAQAILWDTFMGEDGKYNAFDNPEGAAQKLGGGGAAFWTRDMKSLYSEVFKNDSPAQQSKYIYLLKQMQLEAQINQTANK